MSARAWRRARPVFEAALDVDPGDRCAWLARRCAADPELLAAVGQLLADHDAAESDRWLEGGVSESVVREAMVPDGVLGRTIADFRIQDRIGTGGMATVFLAEQQHPRRLVALKVMRFGLASDAARRRFEYESEVLATLHHPGIAQIHATGTYEDELAQELPFFAMELVAGALPLHEFVAERRCGFHATLGLFAEVCRAVSHGHQRGFLHRDLKPQNILVGEDGRPKIIDFGIARMIGADADADAAPRTQAGELLGTLPYMSPEQVDAEQTDLDVRCDVYALGVILFQLVTGRLPFDFAARPITAAIEQIRAVEPPRPSAFGLRHASVPDREGLDLVIRTAMAKDRDRRYASVGELADDIDRILADEPVLARPPGRGYVVRKFVRRHRIAVAAAVLVVLSLVAGFAATTVQWLRAREAERQLTATLEQVRLEEGMARAVNEFLLRALRAPSPYESGPGVKVVEVLDKAARRAETFYSERPLWTAALKQTLGTSYVALGQTEKAIPLLRDAIEKGRSRLDPGHFQMVRARQSLATCYLETNRLDEAEQVARTAYEARRRAVDGDDEDAAGCLYTLGVIAFHREDYATSESRFQQVRAEFLRLGEPGHTIALQCGTALAEAMEQLGRRAEAIDLLRQHLEQVIEFRGEDDALALVAANNLGGMLGAQGRFAESAAVLEGALAAYERVFGREHERTLVLVNNIATAWKRNGQAEKAVEVYTDLIARRRRGEHFVHLHTAIALMNLGVCLEEVDRLDRAETEFTASLAMLAQCGIPERSWLTAACRKGLAVVRVKQERFSEAEASLRDCVAIFQASPGDQSARIRRTLEALATLYDAWGKPEEAERVRARLARRAGDG